MSEAYLRVAKRALAHGVARGQVLPPSAQEGFTFATRLLSGSPTRP